MAEYPNMTVLWAMRDFCLKRVDGRNGRGYIWNGGREVGDGKNSVMLLVWFVFFFKKNYTETHFHCRNTDIAIDYYNLRVSLVGGPITQNFDKSNSYRQSVVKSSKSSNKP